MKTQIWRSERERFKKYMYANRWHILLYSSLFVSVYGAWLFNTNPHIDTEPVINSPYSIYFNWLQIGRYGLVITEYIFGLRWFNPFISTTFGYALFIIAGLLFGYLLWRSMQKQIHLTAAFGLLCFVSPIMAEQLYFDLQIFQIAWAYCLCAIGAGLSYYGILHGSKWAKIAAIICMVWEFSSYQIFVALHIAIVIACFVGLYNRNSTEIIKNNFYSCGGGVYT